MQAPAQDVAASHVCTRAAVLCSLQQQLLSTGSGSSSLQLMHVIASRGWPLVTPGCLLWDLARRPTVAGPRVAPSQPWRGLCWCGSSCAPAPAAVRLLSAGVRKCLPLEHPGTATAQDPTATTPHCAHQEEHPVGCCLSPARPSTPARFAPMGTVARNWLAGQA
jgi:hypothetical protein